MNLFVPSAGSKWLIEAPYLVSAVAMFRIPACLWSRQRLQAGRWSTLSQQGDARIPRGAAEG